MGMRTKSNLPVFSVKHAGTETWEDYPKHLIPMQPNLAKLYEVGLLKGPEFDNKSDIGIFNNGVSKGFENRDFSRYVITEGKAFFKDTTDQLLQVQAIDHMGAVEAMAELTRDGSYRYVLGAKLETLNSIDAGKEFVMRNSGSCIMVPPPEDRPVPLRLLTPLSPLKMPTPIPASIMMPDSTTTFNIDLGVWKKCGECVGTGQIETDEIDHISHRTRKVKVNETQKMSCVRCGGTGKSGGCYHEPTVKKVWERVYDESWQRSRRILVSSEETPCGCSPPGSPCPSCVGEGFRSIIVGVYKDEPYDVNIYKHIDCEDCKGGGKLFISQAPVEFNEAIKAFNDSITSLNSALDTLLPQAMQKAKDYNLLAAYANGRIEIWNGKIRARIAEVEKLEPENRPGVARSDTARRYQIPPVAFGEIGVEADRPIEPIELLHIQMANRYRPPVSSTARGLLAESLAMLRG